MHLTCVKGQSFQGPAWFPCCPGVSWPEESNGQRDIQMRPQTSPQTDIGGLGSGNEGRKNNGGPAALLNMLCFFMQVTCERDSNLVVGASAAGIFYALFPFLFHCYFKIVSRTPPGTVRCIFQYIPVCPLFLVSSHMDTNETCTVVNCWLCRFLPFLPMHKWCSTAKNQKAIFVWF